MLKIAPDLEEKGKKTLITMKSTIRNILRRQSTPPSTNTCTGNDDSNCI